MNRTKAYIRGLTSITAQRILTKAIGLFVTPIVLSYLGQDAYGMWITIGSFIGYMGIMDVGITGSVTQMIAKSDTKDQMSRINTIVNNSFFLQIAIGLVIILTGSGLSFFFPSWFKIDTVAEDTVWLAFLLAAISYGIALPPKTLKALIKGKQRLALVIWMEFFLFLIRTGLNLLLLEMGFNLIAMPIGALVVGLLAYPFFLYMAKKSLPALSLHIKNCSWKEAKGIFKVSSVWFIGMISAVVIYTTDTIIIGTLLSVSLVTTYALTYRLTEIIREFIYSISATAMPGLGQLTGEGDIEKIRAVFITMLPLILNLAISAAFFIAMFNQIFVSLWVGSDIYGGDTLNAIFAATLFTTVVFHSFSVILSSGLHLNTVVISRAVEAILNILLSLWLVEENGLIGVALGTVIASLMTSFWAVPYFAAKYMKLSLHGFVVKFLVTLGIPFVLYLLLLLLTNMYEDGGHLSTVFKLVLWVVASIVLYWVFGLPKEIRGKILEKIRWPA